MSHFATNLQFVDQSEQQQLSSPLSEADSSSLIFMASANVLILICLSLYFLISMDWSNSQDELDRKAQDNFTGQAGNNNESRNPFLPLPINSSNFLFFNRDRLGLRATAGDSLQETLLTQGQGDQESLINGQTVGKDKYFEEFSSIRNDQTQFFNSISRLGVTNTSFQNKLAIRNYGRIKNPNGSQDDQLEEDVEQNDSNFAQIERPQSWTELISKLCKIKEQKLFKDQNPDGFFYLEFLKRSTLFFTILTVTSCGLCLPVYIVISRKDGNAALQGTDKYSIANALADYDSSTFILCMTLLYTVLAYYFVFTFAKKMSDFEFQSQFDYLDKYVARHSVIIRGINQQIGTEKAQKKVETIFSTRFGEQLISCQSFRRGMQAQKIYNKCKNYTKKYQDLLTQHQTDLSQPEQIIWVGSRHKCKRRQVKALEHYQQKAEKAQKVWDEAKKDFKLHNEGIIILVFKSIEAVRETFKEFEVVQKSFEQNKYFANLKVQDWSIYPAIPQNDLLWPNIKHVLTKQPLRTFYASFMPSFCSAAITAGFIALEVVLKQAWPVAAPYLLYLTTTGTVLYLTIGVSYFNFKCMAVQNYYTKSEQESQYMARLGTAFMVSMLVVPILAALVTSSQINGWVPNLYQAPTQTKHPANWTQLVLIATCLIEDYYLRLILQILLLQFLLQAFIPTEDILKAYVGMLKLHGKNKLTHYLYDMGLRHSLAAFFFAVGLVFSICCPLLMPLIALLFFVTYVRDKYNLIFVYPLEFESQMPNRRALIRIPLVGIVFFQIFMISLKFQTLKPAEIKYYTVGFVLVQIFGLWLLMSFMRHPWLGKVQKSEEADRIDEERLIDDISSYDFSKMKDESLLPFGAEGAPSNNQIQRQKSQNTNHQNTRDVQSGSIADQSGGILTRKRKLAALKDAYNDPYDELFRIVEQREQYDQKIDLNQKSQIYQNVAENYAAQQQQAGAGSDIEMIAPHYSKLKSGGIMVGGQTLLESPNNHHHDADDYDVDQSDNKSGYSQITGQFGSGQGQISMTSTITNPPTNATVNDQSSLAQSMSLSVSVVNASQAQPSSIPTQAQVVLPQTVVGEIKAAEVYKPDLSVIQEEF